MFILCFKVKSVIDFFDKQTVKRIYNLNTPKKKNNYRYYFIFSTWPCVAWALGLVLLSSKREGGERSVIMVKIAMKLSKEVILIEFLRPRRFFA